MIRGGYHEWGFGRCAATVLGRAALPRIAAPLWHHSKDMHSLLLHVATALA
jgi:hypothetical protein